MEASVLYAMAAEGLDAREAMLFSAAIAADSGAESDGDCDAESDGDCDAESDGDADAERRI
ncbi:MAG: hypothetical protein BJ554DRAFT_5651 [Olpidium bornovanus]|uniref:Uncharacterized protein n=1 Tax=Olpidium bornovanus TaxID=278681 RepID=A0A8H7ZZF6_9FUNG|nr:MAG: hypothetical protein BJ554DRAFT_5651 [Olpidium bornovanus]